MFWHDLRLAWQSVQLSAFISAVIVAVMAVGIGTSVVAITLYHAKAGNPIWWKNDVLFRPLLDSRPWGQDMEVGRGGGDPPYVMIYRDALALYQSNIPERSVMMLVSVGSVEPTSAGGRPIQRTVRLTTREFFPMFDVPFLYGHDWSDSDDESPSQVVVITRYLSERLYGAGNSVGRSLTFNGQQFTVIGVIDHWLPVPRFYDVGNDFGPANDLFVPFKWASSLTDLQFPGYCQETRIEVRTFKEIASGDCIAIALWTELANRRQHDDYWQFMDNYSRAQIQAGRFVRPVNNRLANVSTWLEMNDVVGNESRFLVILALVFLGICILNTTGLLLAKFLSFAPITGLRRALGATRADVMRQHLLEVAILGVAGGVIGIGLAAIGLRLIRVFLLWQSTMKNDSPDFGRVAQSLSHMDWKIVLLAVGMSFVAGILSGIYPAWRVGRLAPATFLKIQ
jgi:putative ABC transport system permease protein